MKALDELREFVKTHLYLGAIALAGWKESGLDIADRIDAEHQKALDEWKAENGQMWLKGYSECHAELMEGNETLASDLERCGWVRLPVDAEGEPIHVGDVMEFSEFEIEHPVTRTVEGIGQGTFFAWCGERGYQQHDPKRYRHHRPPTVEDVLFESLRHFGAVDERTPDVDEWLHEQAKRLRLVGDGE